MKLFAAVLLPRTMKHQEVEKHLEERFSEVENRSDFFDFSHTNYYKKEMGEGLHKYFVIFAELIDPHDIAGIKLLSNEIEDVFADADGNRKVNIDPGYISEAKILLATTKNFDHRIYIDDGIFGDIQLRLRYGNYVESDWTYPDYRLPEVKEFFIKERNKYHKQIVNKL